MSQTPSANVPSEMAKRFRTITLLLATLGLVALAGCHSQLAALTSVAEFDPVRPGVAVCFVFAGLGLYLVQRRPAESVRRWLLGFCIAVLSVIGLHALAGYALAASSHAITGETMAPNTALCFALYALALLILQRRNQTDLGMALAGALAILIGIIGLAAIFGHAADMAIGYRWGEFPAMAAHSAAGFALLGTALFTLLARQQAWTWALDRTITACFVTGLLVLLAVGALVVRTLHSFERTTAEVAVSHRILGELGNLQREIAENGLARRTMRENQTERQRSRYATSAKSARDSLMTLRNLTATNPAQRARVDAIVEIFARPLWTFLGLTAPVPDQPVPANPPSTGRTDEPPGRRYLRLLTAIGAHEKAALRAREDLTRRTFDRALFVVPLGSLVSVFLLSAALILLNREAGERQRSIVALRSTEQQLRDSEARYRLLFERSPLPMWLYDLESLDFVAVNEATTEFYGYTTDEFLAMRITDIRPTSEVPALLDDIAKTPPTARSHSPRVWRHHKKDGTEVLMDITSHQLAIDRRRCRLVLANDVTVRVQAEEALRRSEAEVRQLNEQLERRIHERTIQLEEANRELESFSYSVSHDLRAPLRHVQGYVAMLERVTEGQLSDKARRYVKTINDASVEMGQLIDDLLEFSRMGRTEISAGRVALGDLVAGARVRLETTTRGRNIEWRIAPLPDVIGDAAMLRQVMLNLIGNAVKYTRRRDRAVIEIGRAGEEDGRAVIFVRDNGAGFDMAYAHKLFGVFQRLHRADEFEGTGIGLATVRRVIARHGGRVWAEGAVDDGASFYFTLRLAEAAPHEAWVLS